MKQGEGKPERGGNKRWAKGEGTRGGLKGRTGQVVGRQWFGGPWCGPRGVGWV